jgi:DICT domain-containing protein
MTGLTIKDVAARTGVAAGTIRMWEQRYGFPEPSRSSGGYRLYTEDDVDALRRVAAYRQGGLSVPAAIARVAENGGRTDPRSIYAAVAATDQAARPHVLRKATLIALSRAIEHEALAHGAASVLFGAFQREPFYRVVQARYQRMARFSDAAVVFADFAQVAEPAGGPVEIPIGDDEQLGNEWAVIVDAPGYSACLLAWELPDAPAAGGPEDLTRRFEAMWTVDPRATRRAAQVAARLAGKASPATGERLEQLLEDRPLAVEQPAPALTALTNRMVAYLEE